MKTAGRTFDYFAELEPRLKQLPHEAFEAGVSCTDGIDWREWESVKQKLKLLVGHYRLQSRPAKPGHIEAELCSSEAYTTTYAYLLDVFESQAAFASKCGRESDD